MSAVYLLNVLSPGYLIRQNFSTSAKMSSPSDEIIHAQCDWKECSEPSTNRCGGCGVARYCSKECQLKDWKCAVNPHKAMCKILKSREDTSGGTCSALNAADAGADEVKIKRWEKMVDIGQKLQGQYEYDKAMQTFHRCLSDFTDVYDALCLARTFQGMSAIYREKGEYAKSILFGEKALIHQVEVLGPEHSHVSDTLNNMAGAYFFQGNNVKALEYYEKSLAIDMKTVGAEHPNVATALGGIASVYYAQHNDVAALEYYQKSVNISLKVLGPEHGEVAGVFCNIANVYNRQKDYAKALEFYEKAVAIWLKTKDPSIGVAYSNMAGIYNAQGYSAMALMLNEKALAIKVKTLGDETPNVAMSYSVMASGYEALGDNVKALELYEKCFTIRLTLLGPGHSDTKAIQEHILELKERIRV